MFNDDAKYLKKHIRTTDIDVHPTEKALVVKYEMEATILGELGDPMVGERKDLQKIVRLKDLNEQTDVAALTREVVDRCKLIPATRLAEVEQLIYYLQKRKTTKSPPQQGKAANKTETQLSTNFGISTSPNAERASLNRLEDYIEMLYEDIPEKVRGTALVLQLARNQDNLEELMANETLIGALARVLREDWKKNFDLATNITYAFFCFSMFSKFHSMISHFKVGALCVQIIETELDRYEVWRNELQQRSTDKGASERKFDALVSKQDQLLRVCIYLLLNLSEECKVEVKMVNRGIVPLLVRCLDRRHNHDLLLLTLTFLKKLSIFKENKTQMGERHIIDKISRIFPNAKLDVASVAARLLYNLSFDAQLRREIVKCGVVQHLASLVAEPACHSVILPLLYNLSMEDECKALLTYTDCIPMCMGILLDEQQNNPMLTECKALLINLSLDKRNAQLIAGETGQGFNIIIERAYERKDVLMMKQVRNIAWHGDNVTQPYIALNRPEMFSSKKYFQKYATQLASTVESSCTFGDQDFAFALECLSVLSNITHSSVDWKQALVDTQLAAWITGRLNSGAVDDDILLEIVILLGTIAASNEAGATLIHQLQYVEPLIGLLSAKQEDDEIVLQIVYVFYQMMFYASTRNIIVTQTQVPAYLIDLMHDKNVQIRKLCDSTLEVIAESGAEWAQRIAEERFRWHNAQWLEMVSDPDGVMQIHPDDAVVNGGGAGRYAFDDSNNEGAPTSARLFDDVKRWSISELYGLEADDVLERYEEEQQEPRPGNRLERRGSSGDR